MLMHGHVNKTILCIHGIPTRTIESDDAGRFMRYKKEVLTPALGFAVRFVQVITKVEEGWVLTRGTKVISQDFPAVRKKVRWYDDMCFIK